MGEDNTTATVFIALMARDLWRAAAADDDAALERVWGVGRALIPAALQHGMSVPEIAHTLRVDLDVVEHIGRRS